SPFTPRLRRHRRAVVHLVHARRRDRQRTGGDGGGRRRGRVERVVRRVRAGDRDARYRDRLERPDVLVGERRRCVAVGEHVTGDAVVGQGRRRHRRAVVHLVHARRCDRQRTGGDGGGRRRGRVERVVRRVRAGDGDARYRDRLERPDVLVV